MDRYILQPKLKLGFGSLTKDETLEKSKISELMDLSEIPYKSIFFFNSKFYLKLYLIGGLANFNEVFVLDLALLVLESISLNSKVQLLVVEDL